MCPIIFSFFFFFNDPAPPEIYPLPLPDAFPIGIGGFPFGAADTNGVSSSPKPETSVPPPESVIILTPKPSPAPAIHGAKVFGVRPGAPFLFTVAATGDRPLVFNAKGLPSSLKLDSQTGKITGKLKKKGEYVATLRAQNALGTSERHLKIVCGPQIGLTPAMGWNSWNCFASAVTAEHVKMAADAMVKSGLI